MGRGAQELLWSETEEAVTGVISEINAAYAAKAEAKSAVSERASVSG